MAGEMDALLSDLLDESTDLDTVVTGAGAAAMTAATPAEGWTVGDTMIHLWFFDREATRALVDPDGFVASLEALMAAPERFMAAHLDAGRALGDQLLATWRSQRREMVAALRAADPTARVPWYGPPMSPMSFGTARLMETWAHGQDIVDALGAIRPPTDRLRHICHLGVRTRGFSYVVRGQEAPDVPVDVVLTAPSGEILTWGDGTAADRVEGPAEDFCLRVTQRRHLADLALVVTGPAATEWMEIAQAFAGGPTLTDEKRA